MNERLKESRYVVVKREGSTAKFLRHEGHEQYWSRNRHEAIEYTRIDVAQALAQKHGGEIAAV